MSKIDRNNREVRPFTLDEYTLLVLRSLIRQLRWPGNTIARYVYPRHIDEEMANSRDVIEALENAFDAVKMQREHNSE